MSDATDARTSDGEMQLRRNDALSRYEAVIDGVVAGYAEFADDGAVVAFPHTVTEPAYGGRGVASAIARFSLDDVRAQHKKARPVCSFYVTYFKRHEEYADLLP